MRTKHQFRPAGEWALEDRVALSHASAAAEIAATAAPVQGLRATFKGRFNAIPPAGLGGASQLNLAGKSNIAGLGPVQLVGALSSNPSLPPSPTNTQGFVNLVSRRAGGTVTVVVNGQGTDFTARTPSTTQLNYTVLAAPPKFASLIGSHGVAILGLRPRAGNLPPGSPVTGQFTLRVAQS